MGPGPGEFGWVTDVAEDSRRQSIYVSEYGDNDRIQKFSPDGEFLLQWGGTGEEPGQFRRPQSMAIDDQDRIWVADACNHRIQVFDSEGKLIKHWGEEGSAPGNCTIPTASRSTAKVTSTSASTATTACRSSRSTANQLGTLGNPRPRTGPASQSLGDRVRQPRPAVRSRLQQPPRAAGDVLIRCELPRNTRE